MLLNRPCCHGGTQGVDAAVSPRVRPSARGSTSVGACNRSSQLAERLVDSGWHRHGGQTIGEVDFHAIGWSYSSAEKEPDTDRPTDLCNIYDPWSSETLSVGSSWRCGVNGSISSSSSSRLVSLTMMQPLNICVEGCVTRVGFLARRAPCGKVELQQRIASYTIVQSRVQLKEREERERVKKICQKQNQ